MHIRLFLILLTLSLTATNVIGQVVEGKPLTAVIVPREVVTQATVYQPECPLKIEYTELHGYLDGGSEYDIKVKHMGSKPIRSFKVAYLDSKGNDRSWAFTNKLIAPGEIVIVSEEPASTKLIPLSDELRKKLDLYGGIKEITVFMIVRVEYTDGTVFDDEKVYNSLKEYLSKSSK